MITKVKLFVSLKNERVARALGMRRLRRAPGHGQRFQVSVDGRAVRARITRFSNGPGPNRALSIPNVYAEEF